MEQKQRKKAPAQASGGPAKKNPAKKKTVRKRPDQKNQVQKSQVKKKRPVKRDGDRPLWLEKLLSAFAALPGRFVKSLDSWFYRIYYLVVLAAIIAIGIGLYSLHGFAADYEASQPGHVADEVAKLFVDGDFDALYDLDTAAGEISGGDRAFYVSTLSALTQGGNVEWSESYASGSDAMAYNVTLNGSRFATFTLVPSGQVTRHNNTLWKLGSVTTQLVLKEETPASDPNSAPCRVQAPEGYAVTVDGRTLTEADVIRTGVEIYPQGFLPEGVTAPTLVEYGFTPEGETPDIAVADPSGQATAVRALNDGIWAASLQEDAALRQQYAEAVGKLAERIAKYTTADISQSSALSDVIDDSPAEVTLKAFKNDWAPSHKSERFEDMAITDFCRLTEDCFTCHVKFNYILTSRRQNDYPYETEYTFCFVRKGDSGKLYNLMFH